MCFYKNVIIFHDLICNMLNLLCVCVCVYVHMYVVILQQKLSIWHNQKYQIVVQLKKKNQREESSDIIKANA